MENDCPMVLIQLSEGWPDFSNPVKKGGHPLVSPSEYNLCSLLFKERTGKFLQFKVDTYTDVIQHLVLKMNQHSFHRVVMVVAEG